MKSEDFNEFIEIAEILEDEDNFSRESSLHQEPIIISPIIAKLFDEKYGVSKDYLKIMFPSRLTTLTPREEKVMRMRFGMDDGQPHTLDEIAEEFKITHERVRLIEAKFLRDLRHLRRHKQTMHFLKETGVGDEHVDVLNRQYEDEDENFGDMLLELDF